MAAISGSLASAPITGGTSALLSTAGPRVASAQAISGSLASRLAALAAVGFGASHVLPYNVADRALIGIFSSASRSMSDSAGRPSVVR